MKKQKVSALCPLLLLLTSINSVNAAEESLVDQFLGSPLIILVAIIVIDIIAFTYLKIRR